MKRLRTPRHLFVNTARLFKREVTLDVGNSHIDNYPGVGTEFKCYLKTDPTTEGPVGPATMTTGMITLYCGPEVVIANTDRIVTRDITYEVIGSIIDSMNVLQKVSLRQESK